MTSLATSLSSLPKRQAGGSNGAVTLQRNLAGQMTHHIPGVKKEPRVVGHDEQGEILAYVDVPSYSERGEGIRDAHEQLDRSLELRQQLLDHANAEKLASRLLR